MADEQAKDEPVLTEEEKGALLEGMATGQVEVASRSGLQYAEVHAFEIGPRSRIVSKSYPRLQVVNHQSATRLAKLVEQMLNTETEIVSAGLDTCTYNEFLERHSGLSLIVEFNAPPLEGPALVYTGAPLIGHLVETFYGGNGNESSHEANTFFTDGEVNVAVLFVNAVFSAMQEVWAPIAEIVPEQTSLHQGSDVIDGIDSSDAVIACDFDITIAERQEQFCIVLPVATIAPLIPVFEGQKRERDAAEDARWERSLRARVVDSVVSIASVVSGAPMKLGDVAQLAPGDVIDISNPQRARLRASDVAVVEGRFGVHDGRYALETTHWLKPEEIQS